MTTQLPPDLSLAEDIKCDRCANVTFQSIILMKKMSALLSPNGQPAIIPIEAYACNACGHVNAMFLPPAWSGKVAPVPAEDAAPVTETSLKLLV